MDLGDIDSDGDLDAWVANAFGQANKVWLNDGSGLFFDSGQGLGSLSSTYIDMGDIDDDGDLDAFVANNIASNKVWLNDGRGIFIDSGQNLRECGESRAQFGRCGRGWGSGCVFVKWPRVR